MIEGAGSVRPPVGSQQISRLTWVRWGIGGCFERLYGPDLIGVFKAGPEFYRKILADAGVDASEARVGSFCGHPV